MCRRHIFSEERRSRGPAQRGGQARHVRQHMTKSLRAHCTCSEPFTHRRLFLCFSHVCSRYFYRTQAFLLPQKNQTLCFKIKNFLCSPHGEKGFPFTLGPRLSANPGDWCQNADGRSCKNRCWYGTLPFQKFFPEETQAFPASAGKQPEV